MPRIIMNSIVRRSSSMIDLNNEISLLECVSKSRFFIFLKSQKLPLDDIRCKPVNGFTWSRATYLLCIEQVRYRFYWVSNQWCENNRRY